MLSRDADSCFWIGRYIERAEATARMIDVHYHFGLESPVISQTAQWSSIITISGAEKQFRSRYEGEEERDIIQFFAFDEENSNSIVRCIRSTRENARTIREIISSEMWESLNRTYLEMRNWNIDRVMEVSPHEFFQWVKNRSHLFQGITNRTLMMGESRDFLDSGRFLERADQAARILDVKYHDLLPRFTKEEEGLHEGDVGGAGNDKDETDDLDSLTLSSSSASSPPSAPVILVDPVGVGGPVDVHGWIAVLKSVGAYEAFRKTFHQVTPANVADFLVLNSHFPASVRHSIGRVNGCLRRVSGNTGAAPENSAERAVGKLYSQLNYITAPEIISGGLHEFLEDVQIRCAEIGDAIMETYLTY
jgi:uncharacterized alpha-E superfamily protein